MPRFLVFVAAVLLAALSDLARAAERPPNIIFVLADDLGWFDLACYGRADHRTPHLDKLAREGMRFTAAYVAQPICSPSRAAIMTGKHPARLHITTFIPGRADNRSQKLLHPEMRRQLPLEERTIAEALKERGYATALVGKWHLGGRGFLPTDQGFDYYYAPPANTKPTVDEGSKGEMDLTSRALSFMETNKARPFFLFLAHNTPHIVFSETPERIEKNKGAHNPVYAAVIERMDESVGKLLAGIDSLGLRENTLVIFTSDNGGLHVPELTHERVTHNGPLRAGKGFLYEGGARVPLIVRWAGKIPAGRTVVTPVVNTDWFATLAEITGAAPPPSNDGASNAGLLLGKGEAAQRRLYWHSPHYNNQGGSPSGALRDGKWKYVEYYDRDRVELFDLSVDEPEANNLASGNAALVREYAADLARWRVELSVQTNSLNSQWDKALHDSLYETIDVSKHRPDKASALEERQVIEWRQRMDRAAQMRLAE